MPGNNREYGVGTPTGELVPGSSFSQNLNQDKNVMLAALAAAGVVTAPMWMGAAAGAGAGAGAGGGGAAGLGAAEAAGAMGGAAGASGGGLTLAQSGGMLGAGGMTGAAGGTAGAAGASPSWINGLSNGQTLGIGANLLGGVMGSNAAGKAADAQLQAGQEANALLREMWQASRADNAPMLDMRNSVLPRIQGLMADPSSITGEPGYQFGLRQGQRALDNKFAASGNYYSGQQLKGATQYAQDYAGTKFDQSLNRLMGVAGMGQVGANNNQAANNNYGTQASSNMTDMGNVRGSGYVGSANAWGNALGGAFNSWQQDEMMRRLLPQRGP